MEVHHAHHPTLKKKWSEYIIEFVMLFAAVTLGFFAENVREHQIINHRIEQNKIAILKDLQEDSVSIARTFISEDTCINRFNKIIHYLYLAKTNKISKLQLIDSIKTTPQLIAYSATLYMNNASFKNMQSSGLFSYLEENELKRTLSTYYEANFKGIESANQFFDQKSSFFNDYWPIGIGKLVRESEKFSKEYTTNDEEGYKDFMINLDKTKNILQSDEFIYEVQKYYNFIFVYRIGLTNTQKNNNKLIQLLKSEIH